MARFLLTSSMHTLVFSSNPITLFFAMVAVLCVFSTITFLCGSEKLNKFHIEAEKAAATRTRSSNSKDHKLISKLNSKMSNRALSMVKMLSWKKVEEAEYSDHDEEALWRKNILMGEKCRPLSFSLKIDIDSDAKN